MKKYIETLLVNLSFLFAATLLFFVPYPVSAEIIHIPTTATCEESAQGIKTSEGCVYVSTFGEIQNPEVMALFLHGDFWMNIDYMAEIAHHHSFGEVMTVAINRPGYYDQKGRYSDGQMFGGFNHYSQKSVNQISNAIRALSKKYKPKKIVMVGYSGGAAMSSLVANQLGEMIDGLFLVACPCDVKEWWPSWTDSLSPIEHLDNINPNIAIRAYVGSKDKNTYPELSKKYIRACELKGLDAKFYLVMGMEHDFGDIEEAEELHKSLRKYLDSLVTPRVPK